MTEICKEEEFTVETLAIMLFKLVDRGVVSRDSPIRIGELGVISEDSDEDDIEYDSTEKVDLHTAYFNEEHILIIS